MRTEERMPDWKAHIPWRVYMENDSDTWPKHHETVIVVYKSCGVERVSLARYDVDLRSWQIRDGLNGYFPITPDNLTLGWVRTTKPFWWTE